MKKQKKMVFFKLFSILVFMVACQPDWTITINSDLESTQLNRSEFNQLMERFPKNEYCDGLLLEQVFYEKGYEIIESILVKSKNGEETSYQWAEAAESLCLNPKGELITNSVTSKPVDIRIVSQKLGGDFVRITDIPATVLAALGLTHDEIPGTALVEGNFEHVVMIFLDGFGYEKFLEVQAQGLIDALIRNSEIYRGLTVYPPRTVTGSAAVLTGLPPKENGVDQSGIRKTEKTTIFDIAYSAGISSAAVEGSSLSFNLRNTEVILSGDRDLNGDTDDNVFANTMQIIEDDMPRLLWIHFHGIDDYGHTYGPNAPIVDKKISEINDYLAQIYSALPKDTLIIYFADHGMHSVDEEGRMGNHGHLIYEDMVMPIIIQSK